MLSIVHDWIFKFRGGERVLKVLLSLFKSPRLFTAFYKPGVSDIFDSYFTAASFLNKLPSVEKYYRTLLPLYPLAVADLKRKISKDTTAILSISHCLAKNVYLNDLDNLCYCLSPFRASWDLKEVYSGGSFLKEWILNWFQKYDSAFDRNKVKFIAISNFIADRIRNCYGVDPVSVIYPPCDLERIKLRKSNPFTGDFYLTGGALVENKNFDLVIEAFNSLGLPLIVFGEGPLKRHLMKKAKDNIKFVGYVSDSELVNLFHNSKAFVFLSIEDFGLTTVEYLASGGIVIGLNYGGTAEIMSGSMFRDFLIPLDSNSNLVSNLIDKVLSLENGNLIIPSKFELSQHAQKFSTYEFISKFKSFLYSINHPSIEYLKPE